jgi:hypothetical protein
MGSGLALFGILVQEKAAPSASDLHLDFLGWLQDAGGFATVGLAVWIAYVLSTAPKRSKFGADPRGRPFTLTTPVLVLFALALVGYAAYIGLSRYAAATAKPSEILANLDPRTGQPIHRFGLNKLELAANVCAMVGGACALLGAALPLMLDFPLLRWRRIGALARLSFREALRSRILWAFLAFFAIFLFPPSWFFNIKAEDELRTNVDAIYEAMARLLLLTAGLLAAFGIPNDLKNQTLHTVVTKPVERFEIVAGRFLGYTMLATLVLGAMAVFSLVLILTSRISKESQDESFKARDVIYGDMRFVDPNNPAFRGDSVGREWEYRRYIAGGPKSSQRVQWQFRDLSALSGKTDAVPCEFQLDIFRTSRGEEGQGVLCSFRFFTWQWAEASPAERAGWEREYADAARALYASAQPGNPAEKESWDRLNELAEKYGYYEFNGKQVFDYHTLAIQVPPALFKKALEGQPTQQTGQDKKPRPGTRLAIEVRCESPNQYLGAAKADLYLQAGEGPFPTAALNFGFNFLKGTVGVWLRLVIVIGLAVTASTYLSGVITFLATAFVFGLGLGKPRKFIIDLADGKTVGGGPFEQAIRMARGEALTQPLDVTPTTQVAFFSDNAFRWTLRRLLNIFPDLDRLDWSKAVAEGFNVGLGTHVGLSALAVLGYLVPWGLLAYYLMKSREIAN